MQVNRVGRGGDDCKALAHAVDDAMRPALVALAREATLAAVRDEDLPTTDPDVMVEAIEQLAEVTGGYWIELADAVADGDSEAIEGARMLVGRMVEVADVLLGQLPTGIEA